MSSASLTPASSPRVLCLLTDGFEEIEAVTPVDLLRRAGVEVVLAAMGDRLAVTGRNGLVLQAETRLADVPTAEAFDLLLLPGGPGVKALRADGRPARLAQAYVAAGKPVAAICAAPLVLHDAGLLTGRRYTAHDSTQDVLTAAEFGQAVLEDGGVLTSRGAGTALAFGLALVERLCGAATAARIARDIMV